MEHPSIGDGVEAVVRRNPSDGSVSVVGRVLGLGSAPQTIYWIGAAPVTRGIGFSGSGQPYPSREIAMEGTPHRGIVESIDGSFSIKLVGIPAGYFSGLGSVYVPPVVEFTSITKPVPVAPNAPATATATATAGTQKRFHASLWINDTAAPYRWISGAPATLRAEAPDPESMGRAMYYFGREQMPLFDNQEAQLRAKGYPGEKTARGWPDASDKKPWEHVVPPA